MTIDIKYIGTQLRWPELAVTGKQSVWFPGQEEERSDAEAAQLLATGLFSRSEQPLTGPELAATRSLVSGAGLNAAQQAAGATGVVGAKSDGTIIKLDGTPVSAGQLTAGQVDAGAVAVAGLTAAGDLVRTDGYGVSNNRAGCAFDVNYAAWPGLLLDPLSSLSGWALVQTNGAITVDNLSNGLPGIKFASNGAGAPNLTMTRDLGDIRYDSTTNFGMWVEVSDPGVIAGIDLLLSNEAGSVFTNWTLFKFGGSGGSVFKNLYWVTINQAAGTIGGGTPAASGSYRSCRIRVISSYKNKAGWIKCSRLMASPMSRPKIVLTFDDGFASQYYDAFRYMSKYGIAGTIGVTSALVGTANYVTVAQLQAMYAAGWGVCAHANTHTGFNSSSTTSICTAQTPASAGAAMTLDGSIGSAAFDAPRHVVVRASADQGLGLTVVGLDASGALITETINSWTASYPVPSDSLFSRVTSITVDGAAAGAVTVGTSLSEAEMTTQITTPRDFLIANGMPRGAHDWIYPQGERNKTSDALMVSLGMRSARVVGGQNQAPQVGDFRRYELCGFGGGGASLTAAAMLVFVDNAINEGRNTCVYLHELIQSGAPASTQTLVSELKTFIDGCAARGLAGKCDFVTQPMLPVS